MSNILTNLFSKPFYQRHDHAMLVDVMRPNFKEKNHEVSHSDYIESLVSWVDRNLSYEDTITDGEKSLVKFADNCLKPFNYAITQFVEANRNRNVNLDLIFDKLANLNGFYKEYETFTHNSDNCFKKKLWFDLNGNNFIKFFQEFFHIVNQLNHVEKFFIQIPWETMYEISVPENDEDPDINNNSQYHFMAFQIGTIVNMTKFFSRFNIFSDANTKMIFKHAARDRFDYQVELLIYLPTSRKL